MSDIQDFCFRHIQLLKNPLQNRECKYNNKNLEKLNTFAPKILNLDFYTLEWRLLGQSGI
jgi:hypothetical protein